MSALTKLSQNVAADGGILDLINGKAVDFTTTMHAVGIAAVGALLLVVLFKGGFTLPKLGMCAVTAGVAVWLITNYADLGSRVDEEVNGSPAYSQVLTIDAPHTGQTDAQR